MPTTGTGTITLAKPVVVGTGIFLVLTGTGVITLGYPQAWGLGFLPTFSIVTLDKPIVVATGNYIKLTGTGVVFLPSPLGQTASRYGSPAWPASLASKVFSISGYVEDTVNSPTVLSNLTGPPKARARSTLIPMKIEGMFDTLSTTDVDNLINFWKADCAMGSLKFTWIHPRTGAASTFVWMKYPAITPANEAATIFTAAISLLKF